MTAPDRFLTIKVRNLNLTGGRMLAAKVTSKGQITIPKKVRDKLGVSEGENHKTNASQNLGFRDRSPEARV